MKKGLFVGLLFFFGLSVLGSYPLDHTDISTVGSASAGLALISTTSSFANPASLYFRDITDSSFYVSGSYHDSIVPSNFTNGEANPLLEAPVSDFCISFSGRSLALTLETQTSLDDRTVDTDSTSYVANASTLFQLDWAVGWRTVALGLSLRAISYSERSPVIVRDSHTVTDYFVGTVLGKYEKLEDASLVSVGLGLLLNYDWFKMGLTSDAFAYAEGDDSLSISSESLFKTLRWGFAFSSPTYDRSNQLNLFKVESALDLCDIGDSDTREIRFGMDLKLQLLPFYSVSLKTGYRETKPSLSNFFGIVPENGSHTIGISAELDRFAIDLATSIPLELYMGTGDDDTSVAVTLALSFAV
jgi:hypothetical protein